MADNVAITAGSGTTVATDERTIASTSVQVQRVAPHGTPSFTTDQQACTSSGGSKVSARDTRQRVVLLNVGPFSVWVGPSGVSTSTGFKLVVGSSVTLHTGAAIHAVCNTSETATLHIIEEYD